MNALPFEPVSPLPPLPPLPTRRDWLAHAAVLAALVAGSADAVASVASPPAALPAAPPAMPSDADAAALAEALRAPHGATAASPHITLSLPDVVDNGAFVPITVASSLSGAQDIVIVVPGNPDPIAARFTFPDGTEPVVATRIKLAASGPVHAVVVGRRGDVHSACVLTQVTVGGCG